MALLDLVPILGNVLDKIIPDAAERDKAKLELMKAQQDGKLDETKTQLSAILAEANSADPWTSRARPTFLYVFYLLLILCVVGGVLGVFWPDRVTTAAQNVANLMAALPEELWWVFGAGYLGYTGARTIEKSKGAAK
jgi:hypothetical protein